MRKSIEVLLNIAIARYISLLKQLVLSPASSSVGKKSVPLEVPGNYLYFFGHQNFHIKNKKKTRTKRKR